MLTVTGLVLCTCGGFIAGYMIGWVRGKKGLTEYPRPGDK